jgi:hypothetical protein
MKRILGAGLLVLTLLGVGASAAAADTTTPPDQSTVDTSTWE